MSRPVHGAAFGLLLAGLVCPLRAAGAPTWYSPPCARLRRESGLVLFVLYAGALSLVAGAGGSGLSGGGFSGGGSGVKMEQT